MYLERATQETFNLIYTGYTRQQKLGDSKAAGFAIL
jgi:hypothetical protein